MTLRAALDALHRDAASWEQVASVTRQAADEASRLNLGAGELSWASLPTGLLDTYTELQMKVVALLEEASEVYSGLSAKLDKVAYEYETNDERAARRLEGAWEVRE
ncbi:hypothetical protein GCM10010112_87690 [Actinoplanes lobatus]|uniref:Excreted virulence factor EspC (Type VII ESX diderm) n=1 Tax=Actinoplanes lobatus TaxID=113568 RepID=A0A7W7MM22_9ACTN|nr:hypothetical protein [Actinoplanes lobatus]MBB4755148.1 hypothetical protein [Actinoplanes lobatus]GGN96442.1 hypothetical protein GCM10010112_87690 [Actinoplanes lobatus]GIE45393.1 hypothetical protein Alo02nite_82910 [Actinoplanes lobatus]